MRLPKRKASGSDYLVNINTAETMVTPPFILSPDNEIVSSRIIDAAIDLVFEACANPSHLENWWGPAGFTNTFEEFDFRPGGRWKFIMHGPDKGNYQNECIFSEIIYPKLITWDRLSKPLFRMELSLTDIAPGKTKFGFRMIFNTTEECNKIKSFVMDKNEENFDRLEHELETMI